VTVAGRRASLRSSHADLTAADVGAQLPCLQGGRCGLPETQHKQTLASYPCASDVHTPVLLRISKGPDLHWHSISPNLMTTTKHLPPANRAGTR
jgi:hypothetical protein